MQCGQNMGAILSCFSRAHNNARATRGTPPSRLHDSSVRVDTCDVSKLSKENVPAPAEHCSDSAFAYNANACEYYDFRIPRIKTCKGTHSTVLDVAGVLTNYVDAD